MAAFALCDKFQITITLFQDAYHRIGSLHAADRLLHNHAALIDQKGKLYALGLQVFYCKWRSLAAELLRTAACDIHVSLRLEALRNQLLHRTENTVQAALGVHGAAPPEFSFPVNIAAKGFMLPAAIRLHHVLMAHKKDRLRLSLPAPFKKKIAIENMFFTGFMHQREKLLQNFVELIIFCFIRIKTTGNGFLLNHFRKLFPIPPGPGSLIQLHAGSHGRCRLPAARPHNKNGRKHQNNNKNPQQYASCHLTTPSLFLQLPFFAQNPANQQRHPACRNHQKAGLGYGRRHQNAQQRHGQHRNGCDFRTLHKIFQSQRPEQGGYHIVKGRHKHGIFQHRAKRNHQNDSRYNNQGGNNSAGCHADGEMISFSGVPTFVLAISLAFIAQGIFILVTFPVIKAR